MADAAPDPLDDLFHGCALAAFLEVAARTGGPPPSEATRRLAYHLYESALAETHRPTAGPDESLDTRHEPCYPSPRTTRMGDG